MSTFLTDSALSDATEPSTAPSAGSFSLESPGQYHIASDTGVAVGYGGKTRFGVAASAPIFLCGRRVDLSLAKLAGSLL